MVKSAVGVTLEAHRHDRERRQLVAQRNWREGHCAERFAAQWLSVGEVTAEEHQRRAGLARDNVRDAIHGAMLALPRHVSTEENDLARRNFLAGVLADVARNFRVWDSFAPDEPVPARALEHRILDEDLMTERLSAPLPSGLAPLMRSQVLEFHADEDHDNEIVAQVVDLCRQKPPDDLAVARRHEELRLLRAVGLSQSEAGAVLNERDPSWPPGARGIKAAIKRGDLRPSALKKYLGDFVGKWEAEDRKAPRTGPLLRGGPTSRAR